MTSEINNLVKFSNHLADESEKIIKKYFRKPFSIDRKKDESPVTIADKNTELKIREIIELNFPDHSILGEEFNNKNTNSEYTWVIDPIDGTRSFIAGHKDFGTLIALLKNDDPIIGIINCPMHNERWLGVKDKKTLLNGIEVKTSNIVDIDQSYLFTSGLYFENEDFRKNFEKIVNKTKYHRYGGDCYMYGMISSGLIEIVVEDTLKAHDYMALIPVIEGAGGKISDKHGKKVNIYSDGSIIASANETLHSKIIEVINT